MFVALFLASTVVASLIAWLGFSRVRTSSSTTDSKWRYVPVVAGGTVFIAGVVTYGVGFLLVPLALVLTIIAAKRIGPPRGNTFWLGASLTTWLSLVAGLLLGLMIHDSFL